MVTSLTLICRFQHQYDTQGGLCGICGDPYDEPQPRTHEIGGPYYKGILVRNYAAGQVTTGWDATSETFLERCSCPQFA